MQPFDYTIKAVDPGQRFLEGVNLGQSILRQRQEDEMARQQAMAQAEELARRQEVARRFWANQNPTARDILEYSTVLPPEQVKALQSNFDNLSKEAKQQELSFGAQVVSSLMSKNPTVARQILVDRAEAERNAGRNDKAAQWDAMAQAVEAGPDVALKMIAPLLGALPDGDKVLERTYGAMEQPAKLEKLQAEAKEKTAAAKIKDIELKFAPDNFAADLGLKRAQISQARAAASASAASAEASRASARRADAESRQISQGIIPIDKRPEAESKFRKEYTDQTKTYRDTKEAYARVLSAQPGAVGDIALIYGYMKMQDPGSVVREGEYATAENARGVQDSVRNIYNKVMAGERLTEAQRRTFKAQAKKTFEAAAEGEKVVRNGIDRIAKGYGLNTDNIFYEARESVPQAATDEPPPGAVRIKR